MRTHTKVFRTFFDVLQINGAIIAMKIDPIIFFPLGHTVCDAILLLPYQLCGTPDRLYVIDKARSPAVIHR